ncbi:amidase [Pseudomonas sp. 1-7]|nr:amidase [Pseudomonas sp. 1-7]
MSDTELHYLEAYELSLLIRTGKLSPVEVTEAMLARIDRLDGELHSYARVTPELALEQAREAERELMRGQCRSPLHGIPIAHKDLLWTAGVPTAAGMPIHSQFVPKEDATVVARLREAGAVMLGKLQMTEGAFAIHHPDCPCAANGLTGLKPTWGRVSRYGAFELAASLDHIGPITRSARDALFMLSTIAGHDPRDPTSLPSVCLEIPGIEESFRGLRVGIDEAWLNDGVDPVIQQALQQVMAIIRDGGGLLQAVRVPDARAVSSNWEVHCGVQTAVAHADTYPQRAAEYGPALSRLIDGGRALSGMNYQRMLLDAQRFTGEVDALFKDLDLLLAPVQPYAAPTHEQLANLAQDPEANRRLIQFTSPFNVSGHPCLSLPCGFTEGGLPVGCQFIAGKGGEGVLCRAGIALQKVTDWHKARPLA